MRLAGSPQACFCSRERSFERGQLLGGLEEPPACRRRSSAGPCRRFAIASHCDRRTVPMMFSIALVRAAELRRQAEPIDGASILARLRSPHGSQDRGKPARRSESSPEGEKHRSRTSALAGWLGQACPVDKPNNLHVPIFLVARMVRTTTLYSEPARETSGNSCATTDCRTGSSHPMTTSSHDDIVDHVIGTWHNAQFTSGDKFPVPRLYL
jgi:hypothetical protein